jgi:hypothetical protein
MSLPLVPALRSGELVVGTRALVRSGFTCRLPELYGVKETEPVVLVELLQTSLLVSVMLLPVP